MASPAQPKVSAQIRLLQAQARRVQAQIDAAKQPPNVPAQAAAGGTIRRPGGEPLPALRGIQATAATPVGGPVGFGGGIASGPNLAPPRETPAAPLRPVQFGGRDPETTDARFDGDKWVNTLTRSLFVWRRQAGEWLLVGGGVAERTIGIELPVVGNVYPVKAVAEARYRLISLSVRNTTSAGVEVVAGTATVLVNGVAATMGTTEVEVGDYVGLRVDTEGGGVFLSASILAGLA